MVCGRRPDGSAVVLVLLPELLALPIPPTATNHRSSARERERERDHLDLHNLMYFPRSSWNYYGQFRTLVELVYPVSREVREPSGAHFPRGPLPPGSTLGSIAGAGGCTWGTKSSGCIGRLKFNNGGNPKHPSTQTSKKTKKISSCRHYTWS